MTNYNGGDDDGDEGGNVYGNNNDNAAYGSGSDVPTFDPIITPCYHGGGLCDNRDGCYSRVALYIYHFKDMP